jgi:hypothetical protein
MNRLIKSPLLLLLGLVLIPSGALADLVGEFSIAWTTPLTAGQLARLRKLVAQDPEAQALARRIADEAADHLDDEPTPLKVIHYEGLVHTHPKRIATVAKLKQMGDAAKLVQFWQVSGDARAAAQLRKLILAWTSTYELTGNDVNENKFKPLLVAYHALREGFAPTQRQRIDQWVEELGKLHFRAVRRSRHFTNRYSKHVRLLALTALILEKPEWTRQAHEGIKRFVSNSLYGDGASHDLRRRDTLTYHCSSLKPPIELAMLAGSQGRDMYTWTNRRGGSIAKSVDYVVPFALGEKTHREWVHTKVKLDKKRAEAGLEKYRPGRLFDPEDALELMEAASYFDADLTHVVEHLTEGDAKRFPTWRMLVNAAARPVDVDVDQDGS